VAPGVKILLWVLALALASRIEIPMVPVPITLQTLAVTMAGALLGWRQGVLAIVLWLALGAAGLPVLAGGGGGLERFSGPTAGYLFAFPLAGGAVGWLAESGRAGAARGGMRGLWPAFAAMLMGNAICLVLGAGWLAVALGPERALVAGLLPFLPGAVLKSAVGALSCAWVAGRFPTARQDPPAPLR
jgi:biotin transport system substrate-specific component